MAQIWWNTIYAYTKALLGKNCRSSHSCHFVKVIFSEPNFFMHVFNVSTSIRQSIKLLHQKLWLELIGPWRHHLYIYKHLIREKLSKFSLLSFCQKLFFLNQTSSCICSMCLHCIGKVSNCSIKSCSRSWSAHEGTIYAFTKALLGKNCLSSHSCHFVKNYFFCTKLLHVYVQCVYIVQAKYQTASLKAVVGVDRLIKAPSMHIQTPY